MWGFVLELSPTQQHHLPNSKLKVFAIKLRERELTFPYIVSYGNPTGISQFFLYDVAGVGRFELPTTVLGTAVFPTKLHPIGAVQVVTIVVGEDLDSLWGTFVCPVHNPHPPEFCLFALGGVSPL